MSKDNQYEEVDRTQETMVMNLGQAGFGEEEVKRTVIRSSVMPATTTMSQRRNTGQLPIPQPPPAPPSPPQRQHLPYTQSVVTSSVKEKENPWYKAWQTWVLAAFVFIVTLSFTWFVTSNSIESKDAVVDGEYDSSIASLEESKASLQTELEELTKTNKEQADKLSKAEADLQTAEKKLEDAQKTAESLQQTQDGQNQDLIKANDAVTKAESELATAKDSLNDAKAERDKWEKVALEMADILEQNGYQTPVLPNQTG